MYLAVDIGGTKTLLAVFDEAGKVQEEVKFPTPQDYELFLKGLESNVANLSTQDFQKACVAVPGRLDRERGIGLSCGNLGWKNVTIQADAENITHCPVMIENDAKLAGLSEALKIKNEFNRVVYITISTGIGIALIIDGVIDTEIGDRGGAAIMLEHDGTLTPWEHFASGKAIVAKYGKRASEIDDPAAWAEIARDFSVGIIDVIAITEPEVVVIGGGVGAHFDKFGGLLIKELKKFETPMMTIPPIRRAVRPEEAVVYGCYDLIRTHHASAAS
jgi:glucokinase